MSARREFLSKVGVFLVTAACNPEKLFGPCPSVEPPPLAPLPAGRDVFISGGDLDAKLPNPTEESLAIHLSGSFTTKGRSFASHNLGKGWTVDGNAQIALEGVSDMGLPYYCLTGPASSVSGLTLRGNHSKLSGSRRTGGVLLYGSGSIDSVTFRDFGALGSETFVAAIVDGSGPASIRNCAFLDFEPRTSDTQVTVYFIGGERSYALQEGNETLATGGWVQAHTIYQALRGTVRNNHSDGARVGYYGDYFQTKGIEISANEFRGCEHGVQLKLSPAGNDFSHENYTIGQNEIESWGANVSLDTCGPPTETRFIRGIQVDPSLSVENVNDGAEWSRGLRCAA